MKYEVVFERDGQEYTSGTESVCFGSVAAHCAYFLNGAMVTYEGSKKNPQGKFTTDEFKGLRLLLNGRYTEPGRGGATKLNREWWDKHHDGLIDRLVNEGDLIRDYRPDGTVRSIFYPKETPTYLMVSSASLYRVQENHINYRAIYNKLLSLGGDKWLPYHIHQASLQIQGLNELPDVQLTGAMGHMAWYNTFVSYEDLLHMQLIDRDYIYDNVPSMWDNLRNSDLKAISYRGRDEWWRSPNSPRSTQPYGMQKVYSDTTKKRVSASRGMYGGPSRTKLTDLVEAWNMMDDKVREGMKEWGR